MVYQFRDINKPIHQSTILLSKEFISLYIFLDWNPSTFLNLESASKCISQHHHNKTPNFVKKYFWVGENKLVNWCHEQDTIHFFSVWQLKKKSLKNSLIRNSRFLSFFNWEVLLISFRFLFGEFVIIWARYTCINSSENL